MFGKKRPGYPGGIAAGQFQEPEFIEVFEFFTYSADFLPATGGALTTVNLTIQADANFIDIKHTFTDFGAANTNVRITNLGTTAAPAATVLLTNTGSGRNLMDAAVHILNLFGTAQFPFILPYPIELMANSTLQVGITNLTAATDMFFRLSFHGYKAYKRPNPNYRAAAQLR